MDLSVYGGEEGWEPIGTGIDPFTGYCDGDGHTISNLFIDRITEPKIGLFGYTGETATILDLGLANVDIRGNHDVGGLVGWNEGVIASAWVTGDVTGRGETGGLVGVNYGSISESWVEGTVTDVWGGSIGGLVAENYGRISNCHADAVVSSVSSFAGGMVGANYGIITTSSAVGPVEGSSYVGGLVGLNSDYNSDGIIDRCYATGTVRGTEDWINYTFVGGLVGYNRSAIFNSYARGAASGQEDIGGLVGYNADIGSITNCYSTGTASGDNFVGGLVGYSHENGSITESYWDTDTSLLVDSAGGTGKTTDEMKQRVTYENWNFANIWGINSSDNDGYPFLRWQGYEAAPTVPGKPLDFMATPGNSREELSWSAPTDDGDSDIISYKVYKEGDADWTDVGLNTSYTFTGLLNGVEYTFYVRAVNRVGEGEWEIVTATPEAPAVPTYTVTVNGSYAATSGAGSYAEGDTVTINAGSRSNYRFNGWTSPDEVTFGDANSATTTFIMPPKNVTVTATWTYTGGGGGGGSTSTPSAPDYRAIIKSGSGTEKRLQVRVARDMGTVFIEEDPWSTRPQDKLMITMPSIQGVGKYSVDISPQNLSRTDTHLMSFYKESTWH
ncbi:MAG: GLUG motif-containing protein [Tepidanaerobacteraceae bacterium]